MRPSVLITKPMTKDAVRRLEGQFDVHTIVGASDPLSVIDTLGDRIRGIAGGKVTGEMMNRLPQLEIIANSGVGVDTNDMTTARARKLVVTNTPDVLNDSVAELAISLMLGLARGLPRADRHVREGIWRKGPFDLGRQLTGKSVGLFGLGRIGKEIAVRLAAMKMNVAYFGRQAQPEQPYRYFDDLTEMARASDWLVVIAPANKETEKAVTREVLMALGPEGRIVNVARGSLVDQDAMIALLRSGELGGAALDVFEKEPEVPEALCELENVVLSPHQGSRTIEAREAMDALVVENLRAHFDGRPAPNRVA